MDHNDRTTVYVGDLSIRTFESDLYKLFSDIGNITNIKLVKPDLEKQKIGYNTCYAYITFEKIEEAQAAIEKMNFYKMNGIEMRVMFYDKRVSATKGGNVMVLNLDEKIDNKTLYATFSAFGDILSCKVAVDNEGRSKGYGFVQYTSNVAAKKAILYGNGCKCGASEVKVLKFDKEKVKKQKGKYVFTNLYMKNFPREISEEDFIVMLGKFGKIKSLHLPRTANGNLKGFGFVSFETPESAKLVVDNLHNTYPFTDEVKEPFYIQPAQSKSQREEELRRSIEKMSLSGQTYKRNLYVTNIPISYTEKDILDIFSQYGTIISIKYSGTPPQNTETNYAFVCYKTPDEACIAVEKAHGMEIEGMRLRVDYYKSKQDMIREKSQEIQDISQFIYSNQTEFLNKKPENRGYISNQKFGQGYNSNINQEYNSNVSQIYNPKIDQDYDSSYDYEQRNNLNPRPIFNSRNNIEQRQVSRQSFNANSRPNFDTRPNLNQKSNYESKQYKSKEEFNKPLDTLNNQRDHLNNERNNLNNERDNNNNKPDNSINTPNYNNKNHFYNTPPDKLNSPSEKFNTPHINLNSSLNDQFNIKSIRSNFSSKKKQNIKNQDEDEMSRELYDLILSMAPIFKDKWLLLGIEDEKEFADEIFEILMERSPSEVKNMIGLGHILQKNISNIVESINNISKK